MTNHLPELLRPLVILLIIAMLVALLGRGRTEPVSSGASGSRLTAARPLRAVWVENQSAELRSRKGCEQLVARLRAMNVDSVFVEVHSLGFAWYRSNLAPAPAGLPADFSDPLGTLIDQAKLPGHRPLRVHAVLDLLSLFNDSLPFAPPGEHMLKLHPYWVSRDYLGNARDKGRGAYLDPGIPAVRDYLTSAVQELVSRYPVDGIHLSNFRYPGLEKEWGYAGLALRQFQMDTRPMEDKPDKNSTEWVRWRSAQLTKALQSMGSAVRSTSPTLIFSVSGIASGNVPDANGGGIPDYERALQEWPRWAQNGLVDWLVLENFHNNETEPQAFLQWLNFGKQQKGRASLVLAVSGAKNMDSGILSQIRTGLANEVDGVLLYSYQKPAINLSSSANFLDLLGKTVFSPTYVLPDYVHEAILSETAAQSVETLADVAMPIDLPQPVPLVEPELEAAGPAPVAIASSRAAISPGRAILGERGDSGADQAPKPLEEDELERLRKVPPPPELEFEGEWLQVKMKNGTSFVGRLLKANPQSTVYQIRKNGARLELPNSSILETKPYASGN